MTQVKNEKNNANPGEMSVKDVIFKLQEWRAYLKQKWKIILIAGVIGALIGLSFSLFKKTMYTSELSFALADDNSAGGGLSAAMGVASQFGIDLGSSGPGGAFSSDDNLMDLLKSRAMVENTLVTSVNVNGQKETLAQLYLYFNDYNQRWEKDPELSKVNFLPGVDRSKFTLKQDSILGIFSKSIIKKNLTVEKENKKSSIITVMVKTKNELFSKLFNEVLIKTVTDFYVETKTKKSLQNVNILQRLTDSVRLQLNDAIMGVASTSDVNPNPNPALQILRVPSEHKQVDVEANGAMLTELVKNLELAKISLRKETPLIQVIDRPVLPLENDRLGKVTCIFLGGLICAIVVAVFLLLKLSFKNILNE